jgi:hypothetical protein
VSDSQRFQAVYYRAAGGSQPVDEFIEHLDTRRQAAIDLQIERLTCSILANRICRFPTALRSRASFVSCTAISARSITASCIGAHGI